MDGASTIEGPLEGSPPPPKRSWISVKWTVVAILLVFGYFTWQCGSGMWAGANLSDAAVSHFHSELDSQAYDNIISEGSELFRTSDEHDELVKFLAGVHTRLGASHNIYRAGINVSATTNGTFIKVTYNSSFEEGSATEEFTWRKENGNLKLVHYGVTSKAFLPR